ncbi:hypothetical protein F2P56_007314, partial [Juglans regia]
MGADEVEIFLKDELAAEHQLNDKFRAKLEEVSKATQLKKDCCLRYSEMFTTGGVTVLPKQEDVPSMELNGNKYEKRSIGSSAWNCIRIKGQTFPWAKWVWNPALPRKISVTMWKAMHECLPLDDRVRRIGIPIVSGCDCCRVRACEDAYHVLAKGGFVEDMWRRCSLVLGVPRLEGKPWKEGVACWHRRASNSSFSGQLLGSSVQGENGGSGRLFSVNLVLYQLPCPSTQEKVASTVKWNPPKEGWVKLNIDGCSLGNPGDARAGGIIRSSNGEFISGFSVTLGHHSNNFAEVMGLLHGLQNIDRLGFTNVEIELDSLLVIHWLRNKRCGLWYMEDFWEAIQRHLGGLSFSLTHYFREANSAADGFAKHGALGSSGVWSSLSDVSSLIR